MKRPKLTREPMENSKRLITIDEKKKKKICHCKSTRSRRFCRRLNCRNR